MQLCCILVSEHFKFSTINSSYLEIWYGFGFNGRMNISNSVGDEDFLMQEKFIWYALTWKWLDVAFDILYFGDTSLIHQTLKERHEILCKIVRPVKGRLEILVPNAGINSYISSGKIFSWAICLVLCTLRNFPTVLSLQSNFHDFRLVMWLELIFFFWTI